MAYEKILEFVLKEAQQQFGCGYAEFITYKWRDGNYENSERHVGKWISDSIYGSEHWIQHVSQTCNELMEYNIT